MIKSELKHFLNLCSKFERAVYSATMKIPKGQTRSYKWIAQKIGRPNACRAIGNALNKNTFPITIPCHRVIKSDGSIGGFSRGQAAKKRLLNKERVWKI